VYPAHREVNYLVLTNAKATDYHRPLTTFPIRYVLASHVRPLRRLGASLLQLVHGGGRARLGGEQARRGRRYG
jgi:hypothetical protein